MSRASMQDTPLWRTLLSSKVGLVFIVTFFYAFLLHSPAQIQDVTPPTLTAFSFAPTTIDTATRPANVTVNLSATDDLSGVQTLYAVFVSPSGRQSQGTVPAFSPPAANVSVTATASFPQFSETGTWRVSFVFVDDVVGNNRGFDYDTTELNQLGFPTQLVVGGQEDDVTPPTLTAFSFTPTTIDTRSGQAVVTVSVSATDDLSGIQTVQARFASPSGQWRYASSSFYSSPPISLSTTMNATFPQFSETGTWRVDFVSLTDALGNVRTYDTTELNQLGFPTQLVVGGQEDDVTPPVRSIPHDFDADGKTDLAVWRPAEGNWYIVNSATGTFTFRQWGWPSDEPVPGDYDGDGKTDLAVWRPAEGNWYIVNSATGTATVTQWGLPGDIPGNMP